MSAARIITCLLVVAMVLPWGTAAATSSTQQGFYSTGIGPGYLPPFSCTMSLTNPYVSDRVCFSFSPGSVWYIDIAVDDNTVGRNVLASWTLLDGGVRLKYGLVCGQRLNIAVSPFADGLIVHVGAADVAVVLAAMGEQNQVCGAAPGCLPFGVPCPFAFGTSGKVTATFRAP